MRSRSSPVSEPLSATPVLSLEIEGNLVANRPSSGARVQQPAYRLELSVPRGFVKRLATRLDLDPTKRELAPALLLSFPSETVERAPRAQIDAVIRDRGSGTPCRL